MSRPLDHIEHDTNPDPPVFGPRLGVSGWVRWGWRQLTSMRTALLLLLGLALAAVPGSLVPQRSADPNGVTQYFDNNRELAPMLDALQLFDVYSSVWFSAIYLLLFASLIGCIIPRTTHHLRALLAPPPRTPINLRRLHAHREVALPAGGGGHTEQSIIDAGVELLRLRRYRTRIDTVERGASSSVAISAERGYLRETGNLVFHVSLVGVLVGVAVGGGFGFNAQRVVVEGQTFVNSLASYDSFNPGRFFNADVLDRYSVTLESFAVEYEQRNLDALGQPTDFAADVRVTFTDQETASASIRVNEPMRVASTDIYLLGNGYAPRITVRDPDGSVVFSDDVPFLPQDSNMTSLGVVKVPDGLSEQVGLVGFLYPTQDQLGSGAYVSVYPDLEYPIVTLNVYRGDLGIDDGAPKSVYALDTSSLTQMTGGETGVDSIELRPGESQDLPDGLGTVSLDGIERFASLEVHTDPAQGWVLVSSLLALGGLLLSLFIPRRRMWIRLTTSADGARTLEYAGLARGEDPGLDAAVADLADAHLDTLTTLEDRSR